VPARFARYSLKLTSPVHHSPISRSLPPSRTPAALSFASGHGDTYATSARNDEARAESRAAAMTMCTAGGGWEQPRAVLLLRYMALTISSHVKFSDSSSFWFCTARACPPCACAAPIKCLNTRSVHILVKTSVHLLPSSL
jgi:hypothetical protein